jgi:hypothetical protein
MREDTWRKSQGADHLPWQRDPEYSNAGGDDERTAGTLELGPDGFDCAFVELAAFREFRPIVPESDVKDGVGCGCSTAQAFQILQIALMYLSSSGDQRLRARIAARKTEYLVACTDEFRDNPGTDESCCSCYENAHRNLFALLTTRIDEKLPPRLKRRHSPEV